MRVIAISAQRILDVVELCGIAQLAAQSQIAGGFGILQAGAAAADLEIRVVPRSAGHARQHRLHLFLLVSSRRADVEIVVADLRLVIGFLATRRCIVSLRWRRLIRRLRRSLRRKRYRGERGGSDEENERAKHDGIVLKRCNGRRMRSARRCYNRPATRGGAAR